VVGGGAAARPSRDAVLWLDTQDILVGWTVRARQRRQRCQRRRRPPARAARRVSAQGPARLRTRRAGARHSRPTLSTAPSRSPAAPIPPRGVRGRRPRARGVRGADAARAWRAGAQVGRGQYRVSEEVVPVLARAESVREMLGMTVVTDVRRARDYFALIAAAAAASDGAAGAAADAA